MRAIAVHEFGAAPELIEAPKPEAGPGQILVKVEAAGVNPFDLKVGDGALDGSMPHDFPLILGVDAAGTVESVGEGVENFAAGDRVVGKFLTPPAGHGSYAEYVAGPAGGTITKIPDGVTSEQAAALPIAGGTALDLVDVLGLKPGQTVLVVGAAGGVGSYFVQLAAAVGAHVIATAHADDAERMRTLGAREVVDHTAGPVADAVKASHPDGVDALVDLVSGPDDLKALLPLLKSGGQIRTTTFAADDADIAARGLIGGNFESRGGAPELARLLAAVADGRLTVVLGRVVPLSEAPAALADFRSGGNRGKTVLVP